MCTSRCTNLSRCFSLTEEARYAHDPEAPDVVFIEPGQVRGDTAWKSGQVLGVVGQIPQHNTRTVWYLVERNMRDWFSLEL